MVTFVTDANERIEVDLPPRLMKPDISRAQRVRYLISTGQLPSPAAPEASPVATDAPVVNTAGAAALGALDARLRLLEARPAATPLPSEQALAQWAMAAQRVGLSHQELASLVEQTTAACEATAAAAQQRLGELDAEQRALVEQVSATLATITDAASETLTNATQQLAGISAEAIDAATAAAKKTATPVAREAALAEVAKHWGSSVTIAAQLPTETDPTSWAQRWYGRPDLIPGDGALVPTPDALRVFRFTGRDWVEGPAIEPKVEVRDVKASVLDASTKVTASSMVSGAGGGLGGGGGESLLARTVATTGSAMLSESARWAIPLAAAGLPAPDACTITLELTAADGPNAGRKLYITGKALYEGLVMPPSSFTVYSELGELVGQVDVELSIQSAPAAIPPGLPAVTVPAGTLSYQVFARISANSSGTTQFLLAGAVSWMQTNAVIPGSTTAPPQIIPAWNLI